MISNKEADILAHTVSNGRYVTGETFVIEMSKRGLLKDFGPQLIAGSMHYFTISAKGRDALAEWRAAQPKPKKRRVGPAFESWQRYEDACGRIPFSQFWKEIWPLRKGFMP